MFNRSSALDFFIPNKCAVFSAFIFLWSLQKSIIMRGSVSTQDLTQNYTSCPSTGDTANQLLLGEKPVKLGRGVC
jgi:hypothetical protein